MSDNRYYVNQQRDAGKIRFRRVLSLLKDPPRLSLQPILAWILGTISNWNRSLHPRVPCAHFEPAQAVGIESTVSEAYAAVPAIIAVCLRFD